MSSAAEASRITVYFPAGNLRRIRGVDRLLRRNFGQPKRIKIAYVGRIRLLPSRGIGGQHGDGNLRQGLCVPVAEAARVEYALHGFGTGKYSRGREFVRLRNRDNFLYARGPKLRSDGCSLSEVSRRNPWGALARAAASFVRIRHGQKIWIRMLHLRQRL